MNRNVLIALAAGLVVGALAGYQLGSSGREEARPAAAFGPPPGAAPAAAFAGGAMPSPTVPIDKERRIALSQDIVARDPKNLQTWILLGNDYFDTNRAQQAVDAYGKALEIDPNNPDVLTDQGVMYRQLKQFDKALANFKKANQLRPDHVQSLFNMGVVYQNDLHDPAKALQAWEKVVKVAPTSSQAADAQRAMAELRARQGGP